MNYFLIECKFRFALAYGPQKKKNILLYTLAHYNAGFYDRCFFIWPQLVA